MLFSLLRISGLINLAKINGIAIALIGSGAISMWAGIKGMSITGVIQDIVQGKNPKDAVANQWQASSSGATTASASPVVSAAGTVGQYQAYAFSQFSKYGWGTDQQAPLVSLWNKESGWNQNAVNPSSGAAGIPQDITGNMHGGWKGQIDWGLSYISGRYINPAGAWAHETANNWY